MMSCLERRQSTTKYIRGDTLILRGFPTKPLVSEQLVLWAEYLARNLRLLLRRERKEVEYVGNVHIHLQRIFYTCIDFKSFGTCA